jgi:hypothetical protein
MPSVNLVPHPDTTRFEALQLRANVGISPLMALDIRFALKGNVDKLRIPGDSVSRRRDNLWQHTCFEVFIATPQSERYLEFNVAPSSEWAIYQFDSYRKGMKTIDVTQPAIAVHQTEQDLTIAVGIDLNAMPDLRNQSELRIGLSAVIEDSAGALFYWALAHPPGKPDFHHRDSFALTLNPLKNSL